MTFPREYDRLVHSFRNRISSTDKYAFSLESDGIPKIDFPTAVIQANRIGNDYVAQRFYEKWRGQEQYSAVGRFLSQLRCVSQRPRILDAGCGPGTYLNVFNSLGIDISNKMLEIARGISKLHIPVRDTNYPVPLPQLLKMHASEPTFDEKSFDGIWYSVAGPAHNSWATSHFEAPAPEFRFHLMLASKYPVFSSISIA